MPGRPRCQGRDVGVHRSEAETLEQAGGPAAGSSQEGRNRESRRREVRRAQELARSGAQKMTGRKGTTYLTLQVSGKAQSRVSREEVSGRL